MLHFLFAARLASETLQEEVKNFFNEGKEKIKKKNHDFTRETKLNLLSRCKPSWLHRLPIFMYQPRAYPKVGQDVKDRRKDDEKRPTRYPHSPLICS